MSARPVWPVQQPEAPWDDPPAELGYGQMSRHLGARTPPRAVYDARVAALLAALREGAECAALGHELGVDGTVHPRGGDYEVEVDRPATVPELIRVATDHYPAAGSDAADVLLGPYADALDVRRPDDLFALKVALAAMALVPSDLVGQTAYERWANTKPRPSLEDRAMVRAVLWAPWTLWELVDGERVDRLGLSAWSNPAPGPLASVLPCEDDAPGSRRWLARPAAPRSRSASACRRCPPRRAWSRSPARCCGAAASAIASRPTTSSTPARATCWCGASTSGCGRRRARPRALEQAVSRSADSHQRGKGHASPRGYRRVCSRSGDGQ